MQKLLNDWVHTGGADPAADGNDDSGDMAVNTQAEHNGHRITDRS